MAKILIADDNPSIRFLISEIVSKAGHEVVLQAKDGLEAIKAHKEMRPDLLIVDYHMPKLNGISVIHAIVQNDPEAKIVLCTGSIEELESDRMIINLPILTKPFNNNDLIQTIEILLKN